MDTQFAYQVLAQSKFWQINYTTLEILRLQWQQWNVSKYSSANSEQLPYSFTTSTQKKCSTTMKFENVKADYYGSKCSFQIIL